MSRKQQKRRLLAAVLIFAVAYVGWVIWRGHTLYRTLKYTSRGFTGHVFTSDPELGYRAVPNSRGVELFPLPPHVPVRHDENGFRVPLEVPPASQDPNRPRLLSLGCSFTYASGCLAEESYPWLVAEGLQARAINAAQCGYGVAQMSVLASRLIPQHKPQYLTVQFSTWLTLRSQTPFAPTYETLIPVPYYYQDKSGSLGMYPPAFAARQYSLPLEEYRYTPPGMRDFIAFLGQVAFPLFSYEDVRLATFNGGRMLGTRPQPMDDSFRLTEQTYDEFARLARENHCKLVFVIIGPTPPAIVEWFEHHDSGAAVVDTNTILREALGRTSSDDAFCRAYHHWRSNPPMCVDEHFNPRAQKLIASAILASLRGR